MSQYSTGLSSVTNGSATVTGSGTLWLANVTASDSFTIAGDGVLYDVASVDTDTQITLSVNYAGVTAAGVVYTIARDFTSPDNFPELTTGDIETPTIITRALRKIQSKFNNSVDQGALSNAEIFLSVAAGLSGTSSGDLFFAVDGSEYVLYSNDAGSAVEEARFANFVSVKALSDAAAVSASNASTSEGNAATSETNAGNSATASQSSADDAQSSEDDAEASASSASNSETNAGESETAAAVSESNAGTSETNAATSEGNASTSETNAGNSASAASTSASNASTSETNADNSAAAAAISETNAGNSEQAAATSESNAATAASDAVSDHVALPDPHTQYLKESEYEAHRSREDLLKQATLSLDFANNKYEVYEGPVNSLTQMPFNTALDFTRGSGATAQTAIGTIQEVLTDDQRLVGNREGLLIEEARTNLVTYSEQFDNAAWSKFGGAITANTNLAPDGAVTGDTYLEDNTLSSRVVRQGVDVVSGLKYAFYVYAKLGSGDRKLALTLDGASNGAVFDLLAGTVLTTSGGSALIQSQNNGYYLVTYLFEATSTGSVAADVRMQRNSTTGIDNYTGDGTSSVILWGAQVEQGSFPTSYIPTAGAQVTRAADDCVRVLGDEFNRSNFTAFVDVESALEGANATALAIFLNANNRIELRYSESSSEKIRFEYIAGGIGYVTEVFDYSPSRKLLAVSVDVNTGTVKFGYGGQASKVLVSLPNLIGDLEIKLAESTFITSRMNAATFRSVQIFPTALSEAELITLTGGT